MRFIALFIFALFGMLNGVSASSLVDASHRTHVDVWANTWDTRRSGSGCSPYGCKPYLTRDDDRHDDSRWSCSYELEHETCEICYYFDEPQDIVRVRIALWKGDERVRKIKMTFYDTHGDTKTKTFTSSGHTEDYESITVNTDETYKMCMKPKDLDDHEWLSILEVQFMVE